MNRHKCEILTNKYSFHTMTTAVKQLTYNEQLKKLLNDLSSPDQFNSEASVLYCIIP